MSKILDADWGHSSASQKPGRETSKQMRCRLEIALERPLQPGTHDSVPDVTAKYGAEVDSDQELTN